MPVSRLDTAASSETNAFAYTVSAGTNRALLVGVTQEVASPTQLAVGYGGQSMQHVAGIAVGDATDQRVDLYFLNDAGITAAADNQIDLTGPPASFSINAASYEDCVQTTPTVTDTDALTGAGVRTLNFTTQDDGVAVCIGGMGNSGTVAWSGGVTEQTEQVIGTTALGSLADELIGTGAAEAYVATWTTANRSAAAGCLVGFLSAEGITSIDTAYGIDNANLDFDDPDVDINGLGFGASQGGGTVWLSTVPTASGVDLDDAIQSWSDILINLDLTALGATEKAALESQGPGIRWIVIETGGSPIVEYAAVVVTHRAKAFGLSASAFIAASGENTTGLLTAPAGSPKTFGGGRIQDDENPGDTVDIGTAQYREDEWSIEALPNSIDGESYVFRVRIDDEATDAFSDALAAFQDDVSASPQYTAVTTNWNNEGSTTAIFPATEAIGDGHVIGFPVPFLRAHFELSTPGTVGAGDWKYWNGTGWSNLSGVQDNTLDFKQAAAGSFAVQWQMPSDWVAATFNSIEAFYIKFEITTVYTVNPVLQQGRISLQPIVTIADVTGDMTATSALTFAEASDLNAIGVLTATEPMTFAEALALVAVGELRATDPVNFAEAADLDAVGELRVSVFEEFDAGRAYQADSGSSPIYTEITTDWNSPGGSTELFPPAEAVGDGHVFGYSEPFIGADFALAQVGIGTTSGSWQYYNGTGWSFFGGVDDGTNSFNASGIVTWTIPGDWATRSIQSSPALYFVRCVLTSSTFNVQNPLVEQARVLQANGGTIFFSATADLTSVALEDMTAADAIVFAAVADLTALAQMAATSALVFNETPDLTGAGELRATDPLTFTEAALLDALAQMAASDSIVFAGTADLTALAQMAATSFLTFAETAGISAVGTLTAANEATFTEIASLTGAGDLSADDPLTFAETADLEAIGELRVTATLVFSESPTLNAIGEMSATGTLLFEAVATLSAAGELTATATLVFSEAADLNAAPQNNDISADSTMVLGETATLNAIGEMAATADLTTAETAILNALGELVATSALVFSETADLVALGQMLATSQLVFSETADLEGVGELRATSTAVFAATAVLNAIGELTITATLVFSEAADLLDAGSSEMAATSQLVFSEAADLEAIGELRATSILLFGETAVLNAIGEMAATSVVALAETAALNAIGELRLTSTLTFTETASLVDPVGNDLSAESLLTFAEVADLTAIGQLVATSVLDFAEVADINAPGTLAVTSTLDFSEVADINAVGELAAIAGLVTAETADLEAIGQIVATSILAFAEAAAGLDAVGRLTVTSTLVFSETADLVAPGANDMTAVSDMVFAAIADLDAIGEMVFSGPGVDFQHTAALNAIGQIVVTSTLVFAETALLNALGDLRATALMEFDEVTVDLDAIAEMAVTSTLVFGEAGADLFGASNELSATSVLAFAEAATLNAIGELRGTATVAFTETADIEGAGGLSASASIVFDEAGVDLSAIGELSVVSLVSFDSDADLTAIGEMEATATLIFSEAAELKGAGVPKVTIILEADLFVAVLEGQVVNSVLEGVRLSPLEASLADPLTANE